MSVTCLLLVSEKTLLVCWSFFHKHSCRVWVKRKLLKNFKFDYLHTLREQSEGNVLLVQRHTWCRSWRSARCSQSQWRCVSTRSWSACFVSASPYSPAFACLQTSVSTCSPRGGETWQTASKPSGICKSNTLLSPCRNRSKLQNIFIWII